MWEIKTTKQPGGTPVLQDVKHTWDAIGNLTQRQDLVTGETESFTYDPLDRLLLASGAYSESYSYDEIGNITSKNAVSYIYGEDGAGPHAVTSIGAADYTYDDNGNMEVGTARTWDVENRLTSITKGGITTDFIYDGDGNRIEKIVRGAPDVATLYINRYYEKTGAEVTTSYYHGSKLVAIKKDATLSYVMQDHLGGTAATADSSGDSTGLIRYFPYGSTIFTTGTLPTDKKFTGQRLDGTGLYYYGARYYDATIGRFISPDPIVHNVPLPEGKIIVSLVVSLSNTQNQFKGNETWSLYQEIANPQELNRYGYVLNNPLKYIDPTGNQVNALEEASEEAWRLSLSLPPGTKWIVAGGAALLGLGGFIWAKVSNNSSNNKNSQRNDNLPTKKDLSKKAGEIDPSDKGGQYTKAGRALQKHGGRPGSAFEKPSGNPQEINKQGQQVVDDILNNPNSTVVRDQNGGIVVRSPDGRGIYYNPDGTMSGFLEPGLPNP